MSSKFNLQKDLGYFKNSGVDVMAFDDIYPEGHQSGISIVMHGNRLATNGDVRFEQTPGQWQPASKQGARVLDEAANTITTQLSYPDRERHLRGFNPMIYPDFEFDYTVTVRADGDAVRVTVDLSKPVPKRFLGKLCFNLELFPGALFGKPWLMDERGGVFPMQPNGPTLALPSNHTHVGDFALPDARASVADLTAASCELAAYQPMMARNPKTAYNPMTADNLIAAPYAVGRKFTVCPDDKHNCLTVEALNADIKLYDGRMNHNNGWFVLSSEIPAGATTRAIEWVITPRVAQDWEYAPAIQISQVGYHPAQPKIAVIERGTTDGSQYPILYKITHDGEAVAYTGKAEKWGAFLRYQYEKFDFSHIREPGLYKIRYGKSESSVFAIAADVYDRGVWQPVLEYFLPVQMCHMRVSEKYRVWHGLCHVDDAQFAPLDYNHIDGYTQGPKSLCKYKPGDLVPGLDAGGWHDAGDFDLRVESQAGETYILALTYEAFGIDYDATTICQATKTVEIHQPDGKPDLLQQVEHGTLCVVNAIRAVGRHWRGIIERDLRQYVHLGDSAVMTDNIKGTSDDRWVFTENNPRRELTTAAQLAAAARVLTGFNNKLARRALKIARDIYMAINPAVILNEEGQNGRTAVTLAKLHAAAELLITTGETAYQAFLLDHADFIARAIAANTHNNPAWYIARANQYMQTNDSALHADNTAHMSGVYQSFSQKIDAALHTLADRLLAESKETPYGIPYRPHIWGAGWGIQRGGFEHYFLHTAHPDLFPAEGVFDALNFVLGCHPGPDSMSFASGVGAKSATVGYGLNRADWSYIPGGVISGTALIRPDLPELLTFPYLWQQVEYVMGGGSSHYMFLVLAAQKLLTQ
ncbi:MAG: glycoside hydrolase family 9 protein [Defluviitaleaceae bacterium]|nr:glycoside hydrolase family 9 protein [Defluviitaleaceae bacterium]